MSAAIITETLGQWPFAAVASNPGAWCEITEAHADEMLSVMPPIYFSGGFAVGEAMRSDSAGRNTYLAIVNKGARYFARELARADMAPEAMAIRYGGAV